MTETKQEKKLSGFAKGNGKLVHIIVDDVFTFCDRKREMLPEEKLEMRDVGCAKCKQSAIYKSTMDTKKSEPSETSSVSSITKMSNKNKTKKTKQKKNKKTESTKQEQKEIVFEETVKKEDAIEQIPTETENEIQIESEETKTPEEIRQQEQEQQKALEAEEKRAARKEAKQRIKTMSEMIDTFKESLSNENIFDVLKGPFTCNKRTNGNYQIIHKQSKINYFDNVSKEVVPFAMLFLNSIDEELYNSVLISPKDYISLTRKMFSVACCEAGTFYPKKFKEDEKTVIKLRRRKKKNKTTKSRN